MDDPRFEDFVSEFRASGGSAKLAVGTPVLVRVGEGQDAALKLGFRTQTVHGDLSVAASAARPTLSQLGSVQLIAKRFGAAFPDQISLGRATNTDVHLPFPGISKYHAFFSFGPSGIDTITDAGSKNGTWVNDRRLEAKSPVRLADGDLVSLGKTDFVFHTHAGFMQLLKQASGR